MIDPEPVLSTEMLDVLREAARHTLCPIGLALAAALPSGSAPRMISGFSITPRGRRALQSGALRGQPLRVIEALSQHPLTGASLRKRTSIDGLEDLGGIKC